MHVVSEKNGITAALIRHEKPFSVVLPEFFKWISVTTAEIDEQTGTIHTPGIILYTCQQ